jgi:hypothetical protein
MAGEVRPTRSRGKTPQPESINDWKTTRDLWDRASHAEIELERAGKPVTAENIWKVIRKQAPEEWRKEILPPTEVLDALAHPAYKQLLDIRKRLLVIPALKDLGLLKEVSGQGAYIAINSALEDLLVHPERIPVSEKRQLARTFMEMNLRLGGIKTEEEAKTPEMLVDIAAQEEQEREKVLAAIPEMYRDLMGQRWDEERMKNLRTRQAIHISKVNEKMGHAKSS